MKHWIGRQILCSSCHTITALLVSEVRQVPVGASGPTSFQQWRWQELCIRLQWRNGTRTVVFWRSRKSDLRLETQQNLLLSTHPAQSRFEKALTTMEGDFLNLRPMVNDPCIYRSILLTALQCTVVGA
jgi:hypothetical protein